MDIAVRNIAEEFVVMNPAKDATVETADEGLYQRIEKNYAGFGGHELIAAHEFSDDWKEWEMHPHGDEVVLLLAGEITFVLKLPGGNKLACLSEPASYIIVPKGVWHTAKTSVKSRLLFITPGEGTEHETTPA